MKCAERENGKYISIFRLECEDMNSINQAHCYIVSIRATLLIHQLSYNINVVFTALPFNIIDTIRQDFPPI